MDAFKLNHEIKQTARYRPNFYEPTKPPAIQPKPYRKKSPMPRVQLGNKMQVRDQKNRYRSGKLRKPPARQGYHWIQSWTSRYFRPVQWDSKPFKAITHFTGVANYFFDKYHTDCVWIIDTRVKENSCYISPKIPIHQTACLISKKITLWNVIK